MVGHELLAQSYRGAEGHIEGNGCRHQHEGDKGGVSRHGDYGKAGYKADKARTDDPVEADPVGQAAAYQRGDGARDGDYRRDRAGAGFRLHQYVKEEQGDEGVHAHGYGRAQKDDAGQLGERLPIVLLAVGYGLGRSAGAFGRELPEAGVLGQKEGGHRKGGYGQNGGAAHAEGLYAGNDQYGTQSAAHVAADRKVAYALALGLAGDIVGHTPAVGVEYGRAYARYGDGNKHGGIAVKKTQHGYAAARHEYAGGHQPGPGVLVGHRAEKGLDNGTYRTQSECEAGGRGVGYAFLGHKEGQYRRQRAAAYIGAQVAQHDYVAVGLFFQLHFGKIPPFAL